LTAPVALSDDELAKLRASCTRFLTHHRPRPVRETLESLARATSPELEFDRYGAAAWLADFESRVARELGKEAAVFMPTGTMAQQIALRIWCDRARNRTIAFHPTCHLEIHESRGYAMLHDLHALLVGSASQLITLADVQAIADPLAAFLFELPQREIGAQLPPWDELVALCVAARATGAKLHLDGARLWEATPFYGRPRAEICALFDSVYVSFYKGLGALAGAILAGDASFVAEARLWQHRHGGRPVTIAPFALSAAHGFETNLPKMESYRDRALEIGAAFSKLDGVEVVPSPPQTNTFHVYLHGERAELEARAHSLARERGTFVFGRLAATALPSLHRWEFVVGDATLELELDEIVSAATFVAARA